MHIFKKMKWTLSMIKMSWAMAKVFIRAIKVIFAMKRIRHSFHEQ